MKHFFHDELQHNIHVSASQFAVPWEQERGLPGRIIDLDFLDHDDDEPRQVSRRRFLTENDVSQTMHDDFFSSGSDVVEEVMAESSDEEEVVDHPLQHLSEVDILFCHYCGGAICVSVEKYEGFTGKVDEVFDEVEVPILSKHQQRRKPLCKACSN